MADNVYQELIDNYERDVVAPLRAALREAEGRAGQAEREAKGLRGELHDAMRGWSDAQQDARRYLNGRKAEREAAERKVDRLERQANACPERDKCLITHVARSQEAEREVADHWQALQRCVELIEAELEPADSEPSDVSAGVDWVRSVLEQARDALRVEQPREVSAWEFACGCSINSYGWDAEPMLSHDGCRVLSQAVKRPPSGIRVAEPEREDWQAIQKQVDGTARKHREAAERGQSKPDPAG